MASFVERKALTKAFNNYNNTILNIIKTCQKVLKNEEIITHIKNVCSSVISNDPGYLANASEEFIKKYRQKVDEPINEWIAIDFKEDVDTIQEDDSKEVTNNLIMTVKKNFNKFEEKDLENIKNYVNDLIKYYDEWQKIKGK